MLNINIKLIRELNEELLDIWKKNWENSEYSHFFNSPDWFISCLNAFKIKDFYIFICYRGNDIKAILPLIRSRKYGIKVFVSPGRKYLDRTTLLLLENDIEVVRILFKEILNYGSLYLAEIDKYLINIFNNKELFELASENPFIQLSNNPFGHMANKQRNGIKNKINRIENDLKFYIYRRNLGEYLEQVFNIESLSYKKQKKRNVFCKSEARELFKSIVEKSSDKVAIAILYFRDKPIAHMVGLVYNRIFLAYHMAYLADYRVIIPGKILLFYLLPILRDQGFEIFDFSRGNSMLKRQFTKSKKDQYNLYLPRNKTVKCYWQIILFIKNKIKSFKKSLKHLIIHAKHVKI